MITIAFRFPGGRYHATPWGHQVNEGQVEWPPCPWRLLRALISTGYTKLGWTEFPEPARSLFGKLTTVLPSYHLPAASMAHSRHYMPVSGNKKTLVLDTWLNVEGELQIQWPATLDESEGRLLAEIVASLGYLGRSESWVECRILADDENSLQGNCTVHNSEEPRDSHWEDLVSLLASFSFQEYADWLKNQIPITPETGKNPTAAQIKTQRKLEEPFPPDLVEAMQWDTSLWKSYGWSQPPGSRWVQYRRPRQALESPIAPPSFRTSSGIQTDVVLLALACRSGNASALPTLVRTLPQAELLHKALVRHGDEGDGVVPAVLTGRDDDRRPLVGHGHSHILPVDLDGDGHLDHILLWASMGFDAHALQAIRHVRKTWMKGGAGDLRLAVAGAGKLSELEAFPEGLKRMLGIGKAWSSISPFVPPRFLKKNGSNSIEGQVRTELLVRGLPDPDRIEVRIVPEGNDLTDVQRVHFRHFVRRRSRGGSLPPQDIGFFVTITFSGAVQGPLCLGYGSHFGLGSFQTADP